MCRGESNLASTSFLLDCLSFWVWCAWRLCPGTTLGEGRLLQLRSTSSDRRYAFPLIHARPVCPSGLVCAS